MSTHWIEGADTVGWNGQGTHPDKGTARCGRYGDLTDCASNVTCPGCQALMRSRGVTNAYLEGEWAASARHKRMLVRRRVNQPSTLQPYHALHGRRVLYDTAEEVVYFVEGPVISQQIDPAALSEGWPEASDAHSN